MSDIGGLPDALQAAGFVSPSGELAWDPDVGIRVATWLSEHGQAVLAGDALGWRADGSVCDTMTSADRERRLITGWDTRGRDRGEDWQSYCRYCLDNAIVALSDAIAPEDILEEVVAVRYRLSSRKELETLGSEPLPGNPAARYWG